MHGSKLGLLAATVLAAGVAGCGLPHVLPLAGGTTQGPSPYGVWYEQHWATNAVLLAAADQPEVEASAEEAEIDAALAEFEAADAAAKADANAPVEAFAAPVAPVEQNADFSNSSPYQFPAEQFQPAPPPESAPPAQQLTPAAPASKATVPDGPIRY